MDTKDKLQHADEQSKTDSLTDQIPNSNPETSHMEREQETPVIEDAAANTKDFDSTTLDNSAQISQMQPEIDVHTAKEGLEKTNTPQTNTIQSGENAEKSENLTTYSIKELLAVFKKLLKNEKIEAIKEQVEAIKTAFYEKYNAEVKLKKEEFISQGGEVIDFHYTSSERKEFNEHYRNYKEKRKAQADLLKSKQQSNLNARLELIEELKTILQSEERISVTFSQFKSIQTKWRAIGNIPKDKYNTVWNTYQHYCEQFYDFLQLNREFRDIDFKRNLEQKQKLIDRAKELVSMEDIHAAHRELHLLHKAWKEDTGPVSKDQREAIWQTFSNLSKQIHDRRQDYFKELEKKYEKNLEKKHEIIAQIIAAGKETPQNHSGWQQKIKEMEALRKEFFEAGKVPSAVNEEIWNRFKEAIRDFNKNKNAFYKTLKKEQFDNLKKKLALIEIAEKNMDSDDFDATTNLMKKIQNDWKQIGHVPRKDSDQIWKKFKSACNHYFNRVHAKKDAANEKEREALVQKQLHLEAIKNLKLSGDPEADLKTIKENIAVWKTYGRVPYKEKNIESSYNKALDTLFGELNLSRKERELIRFDSKLADLSKTKDGASLEKEKKFIRKKIEELQNEIRQFEANMHFFRHAKKDNPLVKEVLKNIEKHKDQLQVWKDKLKKINQMG